MDRKKQVQAIRVDLDHAITHIDEIYIFLKYHRNYVDKKIGELLEVFSEATRKTNELIKFHDDQTKELAECKRANLRLTKENRLLLRSGNSTQIGDTEERTE